MKNLQTKRISKPKKLQSFGSEMIEPYLLDYLIDLYIETLIILNPNYDYLKLASTLKNLVGCI